MPSKGKKAPPKSKEPKIDDLTKLKNEKNELEERLGKLNLSILRNKKFLKKESSIDKLKCDDLTIEEAFLVDEKSINAIFAAMELQATKNEESGKTILEKRIINVTDECRRLDASLTISQSRNNTLTKELRYLKIEKQIWERNARQLNSLIVAEMITIRNKIIPQNCQMKPITEMIGDEIIEEEKNKKKEKCSVIPNFITKHYGDLTTLPQIDKLKETNLNAEEKELFKKFQRIKILFKSISNKSTDEFNKLSTSESSTKTPNSLTTNNGSNTTITGLSISPKTQTKKGKLYKIDSIYSDIWKKELENFYSPQWSLERPLIVSKNSSIQSTITGTTSTTNPTIKRGIMKRPQIVDNSKVFLTDLNENCHLLPNRYRRRLEIN
ncbi:hypothetical protein SNEBB_002668 [Seison nebaliae]|nr:hypothetical protein SNEBB_002668 [Seison nebaliae]